MVTPGPRPPLVPDQYRARGELVFLKLPSPLPVSNSMDSVKGKIGIVGSGLIGKSWAMIFASEGYKVTGSQGYKVTGSEGYKVTGS